MRKKEISSYVQSRIENKTFSQLAFHLGHIQYYFKNRHKGLAGLDKEQVIGLVYGSIRDYRVWEEIDLRCRL